MWLIFAVSFLYFLPFFVGLFRAHPHPMLLLLANAGLGWTGWGWVVAFVYSLWTFVQDVPAQGTQFEVFQELPEGDPEPFTETELRRLKRLRERTRGHVIEFPVAKVLKDKSRQITL